MSADVGEVKYGKGETGETIYVHFVRSKSGGCPDGVVVRALDVWELNIPVSWMFVAHHGVHEIRGAADTLDTAVGARVVHT